MEWFGFRTLRVPDDIAHLRAGTDREFARIGRWRAHMDDVGVELGRHRARSAEGHVVRGDVAGVFRSEDYEALERVFERPRKWLEPRSDRASIALCHSQRAEPQRVVARQQRRRGLTLIFTIRGVGVVSGPLRAAVVLRSIESDCRDLVFPQQPSPAARTDRTYDATRPASQRVSARIALDERAQ